MPYCRHRSFVRQAFSVGHTLKLENRAVIQTLVIADMFATEILLRGPATLRKISAVVAAGRRRGRWAVARDPPWGVVAMTGVLIAVCFGGGRLPPR